jgi:hypothetical protein
MSAHDINTCLAGIAGGLLTVVAGRAGAVLARRRSQPGRYRPYHQLTQPLRVTPDRTIGARIRRMRRGWRGAS